MMTGILVPGAGYPTQAPLLDLADAALSHRRCAVEHITWAVPPGLLQIDPEPFVRTHVMAALHRVQIPDADHSLRVPAPVRRYAEVLATVGTAVEDFLDALLDTDDGGMAARSPQ